MTATAFPLSWPQGFDRARNRDAGKFKVTLAKALDNVHGSLRRFASDSRKKLDKLVISSNVTLGANRPTDPGVSVWFNWDELDVCIAVDRYKTVEANLQAIHHIIEARRVELRHGTLALVRASFRGFQALPKPVDSNWWQVLGVARNAAVADVRAAYSRLRSTSHPDRGGDAEKFQQVQQAFAEFCRANGIAP